MIFPAFSVVMHGFSISAPIVYSASHTPLQATIIMTGGGMFASEDEEIEGGYEPVYFGDDDVAETSSMEQTADAETTAAPPIQLPTADILGNAAASLRNAFGAASSTDRPTAEFTASAQVVEEVEEVAFVEADDDDREVMTPLTPYAPPPSAPNPVLSFFQKQATAAQEALQAKVDETVADVKALPSRAAAKAQQSVDDAVAKATAVPSKVSAKAAAKTMATVDRAQARVEEAKRKRDALKRQW